MTYLDIVNNVLRRLRERTVSSVSENTYSTLIGILVNDALREVEDSWQWSALRSTTTATTSDGVFGYELTDVKSNATILDVYNDTDNLFLEYIDARTMTDLYLSSPASGSPSKYSFNGISADGDTLVDIYPKPDGVYTVRFNFVHRGVELENNTDVLTIPSQPVILLAYAKAVEERGEDGGVGASAAYAMATRSLSDAISLDAAKHPEEVIWREV